MGGRLDSSNVISPELSIITNISFDHTQFLGDTLAKIAAEKAGIIKENIPVVIGEYDKETSEVFETFANKLHSKIVFADKNDEAKNTVQLAKYLDLCQLKGIYQKKNILTVLTALNFLLKDKFSLSDDAIDEGFATVVDKTGLQGRWQVVNTKPLTVFDTGHNVAGIKEVVSHIKSLKYNKLRFVFGVVADKDITHILEILPKYAEYYFCKADLPRALDEHRLQEQAETFNLKGKTYNSVLSAFENAKRNAHEDDIVLVGGSNFVVAELL
jgi:dihydrofolate synthase/folylpolyglutamate synthase